VLDLLRAKAFNIDQANVLRESGEEFGPPARQRYAALLKQSFRDLATDPKQPGIKNVPGLPGVFSYHMRHSRDAVPAGMRVRKPRHVIFFRIIDEGHGLLLLRLLHDRMLPEDRIPGG